MRFATRHDVLSHIDRWNAFEQCTIIGPWIVESTTWNFLPNVWAARCFRITLDFSFIKNESFPIIYVFSVFWLNTKYTGHRQARRQRNGMIAMRLFSSCSRRFLIEWLSCSAVFVSITVWWFLCLTCFRPRRPQCNVGQRAYFLRIFRIEYLIRIYGSQQTHCASMYCVSREHENEILISIAARKGH